MTSDEAHTAVATSAFLVAGIFAYRKLAAPATGSSTAPSTSSFVVGFMFVYITLSVVAEVAPPLGGMFAWLVALGDVLTNGQAILSDVNSGLHATSTATAGVSVPLSPETPETASTTGSKGV